MPTGDEHSVIGFERLGFSFHENPAARMRRPHRHNEIELTVLSAGHAGYLFGGSHVTLTAQELCVRLACHSTSVHRSHFGRPCSFH